MRGKTPSSNSDDINNKTDDHIFKDLYQNIDSYIYMYNFHMRTR